MLRLKLSHLVKGVLGDQAVRLVVAEDCDQYPNIELCTAVETVEYRATDFASKWITYMITIAVAPFTNMV